MNKIKLALNVFLFLSIIWNIYAVTDLFKKNKKVTENIHYLNAYNLRSMCDIENAFQIRKLSDHLGVFRRYLDNEGQLRDSFKIETKSYLLYKTLKQELKHYDILMPSRYVYSFTSCFMSGGSRYWKSIDDDIIHYGRSHHNIYYGKQYLEINNNRHDYNYDGKYIIDKTDQIQIDWYNVDFGFENTLDTITTARIVHHSDLIE